MLRKMLTSSSALACFFNTVHSIIDAFKATSAPFSLDIKKSLVVKMP